MENKAVHPFEKVQEIIDMIKDGNALLENTPKTDSEAIKLLEVAKYLLGVEENNSLYMEEKEVKFQELIHQVKSDIASLRHWYGEEFFVKFVEDLKNLEWLP